MSKTAVTVMKRKMLLSVDDNDGDIYLNIEDNKEKWTVKLTTLEAKVLGGALSMHALKAELFTKRKEKSDE